MSFPSRLAFVETCTQSHRCTGPNRSSHPYRYHLSTTNLGASLEDIVATTTDVSATDAVGIGQVMPSAAVNLDAGTAVSYNYVDPSLVFPNANNPMMNMPEMMTYLLVAALFAALMLRTNQVEDAVKVRNKMQEKVRAMKLQEMASGPISPEQSQRTLQRYEDAVRKEESLRAILPGVRIHLPPSAQNTGAGRNGGDDARVIAKQYLGRDFQIGAPQRDGTGGNRDAEEDGEVKLALGVVAVVALGQVGLLLAYTM